MKGLEFAKFDFIYHLARTCWRFKNRYRQDAADFADWFVYHTAWRFERTSCALRQSLGWSHGKPQEDQLQFAGGSLGCPFG